MSKLDEIRDLCRTYLEEAREAERRRKPTDGLFGIGPRAADDPCHMRFAETLEAELNAWAKSGPSSGEIREVLEFLYGEAKLYREPASVYWMLMAVHSLTEELAGMLSPEDAGAVCARYEKDYPRRERLPAQKKVLKVLQNRSRERG